MKSLPDNEDRYRMVVEDQTECISRWLPGGILTFVNKAYCRFFGKKREDLIGKSFYQMIPEKDRPGVAQKEATLSREQPVIRDIHRVLLARGEIGWQEWTDRIIFDRDGKFLEYQSVGRDITDQKHAEQALKEERARSRQIVEALTDGLFVVDNDMIIRDSNPAASRMYGYTRNEFIGMPYRKLVHPAHMDGTLLLFQKGGSTRKGITRQAVNITREGEPIRVELRIMPMGDGNPCILAIVRDVTDVWRIQEALKESERKFRELAELSPNMIFINQGGRVVYANRITEKVMGYSRRELLSPEFNFMCVIAPEHHELTRRNFMRHARGEDVESYEYIVVTKSGERIESVINTALIVYEGAPAILGIVTDISGLKSTQKRLEAARMELETQAMVLEKKNTALKEVLAQIETEKLQIRKQVMVNTEKLLFPVLKKIRQEIPGVKAPYLDLLERNLNNLTSEFGLKMMQNKARLTAREIEICNLIASNIPNRRIAELLHASLRTIETHRTNIRKKLGLAKKSVNLATYLKSTSMPLRL